MAASTLPLNDILVTLAPCVSHSRMPSVQPLTVPFVMRTSEPPNTSTAPTGPVTAAPHVMVCPRRSTVTSDAYISMPWVSARHDMSFMTLYFPGSAMIVPQSVMGWGPARTEPAASNRAGMAPHKWLLRVFIPDPPELMPA